MRTFMAIRTNDEVENEMVKIQKFLMDNEFFGTWPRKENAHLTLFFFGDIDEKKIKKIEGIMDDVSKDFKPFSLEFNGVGVFPPKGLPRVLWMRGIGEEVSELYSSLNERLKQIGFSFGAEFTPHLTIGRLKGIPKDWNETISKIEYDPLKVECKDIELFSSTLTPKGSIYNSIHKSEFGG
ncbi:MAG: RNA 2',3'-cyclic phosphodiesterase [Athalassotoga sp.]|uniref:RNA 2',3'-cyclic phosphodiesterase n=1 Tax=Athalassotoga sp. TaxID=2022597 RepID=UPI003CFBD487